MKITLRTFPFIFVILPVMHYSLFLFINAESEEHQRRVENGKEGFI